MDKELFNEIILDMLICQNIDLAEKKVTEKDIIEKIKLLSNVQLVDKDGRNLLINATFTKNKNIVKFLLEYEINVNLKDKIGFTALHAAVQEDDVKMVELLLNNGADTNSKNLYGNNPVMLANCTTNKEIFQLLMQYGTNPYQKNNFGICAIDCFSAYPEIIEILKEKTGQKEKGRQGDGSQC